MWARSPAARPIPRAWHRLNQSRGKGSPHRAAPSCWAGDRPKAILSLHASVSGSGESVPMKPARIDREVDMDERERRPNR